MKKEIIQIDDEERAKSKFAEYCEYLADDVDDEDDAVIFDEEGDDEMGLQEIHVTVVGVKCVIELTMME